MPNSNIIPQGSQEVVVNGSLTQKALMVQAETDLAITALVFEFPASPPNAGVVDNFTLKAGSRLFHVKGMTFTGTASIIYLDQP